MRIAFVVSELRYTGGTRVIAEYASRLAQRGHHVSVVTSFCDRPLALPFDGAVRILTVPVRLDRRCGPRNLRLVWSLARSVPPADIVVATHAPTVPSGLIAARLLRRGRAVWLCQDFPEMFEKRPLQRWIYRHSASWFDLVLCVSAANAADLPQSRRPGAANLVVVGEGLSDKDLFHPVASSHRALREVLYVGDSRPRKGLADVLNALALVRERVSDVTLVVVSQEDLHSKLTSDSPVPFRFVQCPSRAVLASMYAGCGLFVSASWAESFGLPPLEAMACGAPVVVTDSRGVREYARNGANCLMVPARDQGALAEAIVRLLLDRTLADRLGAAGVATAKTFDWEQAVDRFESAILWQAGSRPGRSVTTPSGNGGHPCEMSGLSPSCRTGT